MNHIHSSWADPQQARLKALLSGAATGYSPKDAKLIEKNLEVISQQISLGKANDLLLCRAVTQPTQLPCTSEGHQGV
jgi:hypothetical protein